MKIDFDSFIAPESPDTALQSQDQANPRKPVRFTFSHCALWAVAMLSLTLNFYMLFDHSAARQIRLIEQHVKTLEKASSQQQLSLIYQEKLLASQHAAQLDSLFERKEYPDSNAQLGLMLREQEQDLQNIISTLKESMSEISNMIPGPRNWVSHYAEQLDGIERNSRNRDQALREWEAQAH